MICDLSVSVLSIEFTYGFLGTAQATRSEMMAYSIAYTAPFTNLQPVVKSCLEVNLEERPDIRRLIRMFRSAHHFDLNPNQSQLTSMIICRLATYASELDEQVHNRTLELLEERTKCDNLLLEMLPRFVRNNSYSNRLSAVYLVSVIYDLKYCTKQSLL